MSREGDNVIIGCYWKYCQRHGVEEIMCGEKGAYCKKMFEGCRGQDRT
jgi:hypothetical protein